MTWAEYTPASLVARAAGAQSEGPENNMVLHHLLNVCIAFLVIDTVFVFLRLLSRQMQENKQRRWGIDDVFIIPSWIANVILMSLEIYVVHASLTASDPNASPEARKAATPDIPRATYGVQITFIFAYVFPKLSILFLYRRIFPSRTMHIMVWCLIGFMIVDGIAFLFPAIFLCNPPHKFWAEGKVAPGTCINNVAYNRAIPPPNILTDLIMLIMPIPTVIKLKAPVARRVGVLITFLTGSVGLVASIVRWAYFLRFSIKSSSVEITATLDMLAIIEPSMYTLAACMPPMRALLKRIVPGWVSSSISEVFRSSRKSDQGTDYRFPGTRETVDSTKIEGAMRNNSDASKFWQAGKRTSQYETEMEKGLSRDGEDTSRAQSSA